MPEQKPLVLVLGDCLLDKQRYVTYSRQSPEDPSCPIGENEKEEWVLGGAANVARWIKGLGDAGAVRLTSHYSAHDPNASVLNRLLKEAGVEQTVYLLRRDGQGTVKERLYLRTGGPDESVPWRQVLRIDADTDMELTAEDAQVLCGHLALSAVVKKPAALVIADYGKGVCSGPHAERFLKELAAFVGAQEIPTIINSKYPQRWRSFVTDFLVCNQEEHGTLNGQATSARHLVITRAHRGVSAYVSGGAPWALHHEHAPSLAVDVRDVTGAGDAFLAGLTSHLIRIGFRRGQVLENGALRRALDEGQSAAAACVYQLGCGVPARLGLGEVG